MLSVELVEECVLAVEAEGAPVVGCDAVLFYGVEVLRCGVAFVAVPTVVGVLLVEVVHVVVTVGFGQYGGGGYGEIFAIAFDDGGIR